jgi:hypothetical protein
MYRKEVAGEEKKVVVKSGGGGNGGSVRPLSVAFLLFFAFLRL